MEDVFIELKRNVYVYSVKERWMLFSGYHYYKIDIFDEISVYDVYIFFYTLHVYFEFIHQM